MFSLTLIVCLVAGIIAMPTADQGLGCPHEIPPNVIKQLWTKTRMLIHKLPKEIRTSRFSRLLPKFCTKCHERAIGWLEIKEIIDVYQRSVFSHELVRNISPLHYNELLHRLQHTLDQCVSSAQPSKHSKIIKKMERKIRKSKEKGVVKATKEFIFVLRWIDEFSGHRNQ